MDPSMESYGNSWKNFEDAKILFMPRDVAVRAFGAVGLSDHCRDQIDAAAGLESIDPLWDSGRYI